MYDELGRDMLQHERIGDVTLISLRTALDANTAHRAKEALDRLIAGGDTRLVVDLSNLDYIDSAGLSVLVSILKGARARGGDVHLFGVDDSIKMIFDLTRLSRVFKIFPDREEALSSFAGGKDPGGSPSR